MASGADEPPVILQSTLKQKSLCPGDRSVTFTCTTRCTRVNWIANTDFSFLRNFTTMFWKVNGQNQAFFVIGHLRQLYNHHASMLKCSKDSDGVWKCISVLNIVDPSPSGTTRVECYNATESTIVGMDYHHRVAGMYRLYHEVQVSTGFTLPRGPHDLYQCY